MLRISELELVSRVPAVVIPPQVTTPQAPLVDAVATNMIRINTSSPTAFRNHSPAGNPQTLAQPREALKPSARHIDRFG